MRRIPPTPISIRRLRKSDLKEAMALYHTVFGYDQKDSAAIWFPATLFRKEYEELFLETRTEDVRAWVAVGKGPERIIGITGLYTMKDDPASVWISWFMVHPGFRMRGIGRRVLEWTIDEARKTGRKSLMVYTSTDPVEAAAHILYKKMGFIKMREEREGTGKTIYYGLRF